MSGLSEQDVIELKHSLGGIAELCWTFYNDCRSQGFSDEQALRTMHAWLRSVMHMNPTPPDA